MKGFFLCLDMLHNFFSSNDFSVDIDFLDIQLCHLNSTLKFVSDSSVPFR